MATDHGNVFARVLRLAEEKKIKVLDEEEVAVASSVIGAARDKINEIKPSDFQKDDIDSFDEKIEGMLFRFEGVVKVFKETLEAKDDFLTGFNNWKGPCEELIKRMREIVTELGDHKQRRVKTETISNAVAAVGGLLAVLTLPVSAPVAAAGMGVAALGNLAAAGAAYYENSFAIEKKNEVETLLKENRERYPGMRWFSCPKKLEDALKPLVDCRLLEQMTREVQEFSKRAKKLTDGEFKIHYEQVLDSCMGHMAKDRNLIEEYGKELAPVVMTFIFVVCLLNDHSQIVLDCSLKTQRLTLRLGAKGLINVGAFACNAAGVFMPVVVAQYISLRLIAGLGALINAGLAVKCFIDARKEPETELMKKITEICNEIEGILTYITSVYNETQKYKSHDAVAQWHTTLITNAPDDADSEDLKMAVKSHLPKEAWGRIRVCKIKTSAKNWLVNVPANHSERLSQQTQLTIKGKTVNL